MKKKFAFTAVSLVILCGIFAVWRMIEADRSVKQVKHLFSEPFSAEVTLSGAGGELSAVVGRDESGNVTLTVTDPALLSGTVIAKNDGVFTASYGNFTVPLELKGLPASSAVIPLFELLSGALDEAGVEVRKENGSYIFEGESSSGKYSVTYDGKTVVRAEFPSIGFTCDFSSVITEQNNGLS